MSEGEDGSAVSFEKVKEGEKKWIETSRSKRGVETDGPLVGLAFSGGGIRSATFNLGILQGLAKKNLLNKFDYLSTVSGGRLHWKLVAGVDSPERRRNRRGEEKRGHGRSVETGCGPGSCGSVEERRRADGSPRDSLAAGLQQLSDAADGPVQRGYLDDGGGLSSEPAAESNGSCSGAGGGAIAASNCALGNHAAYGGGVTVGESFVSGYAGFPVYFGCICRVEHAGVFVSWEASLVQAARLDSVCRCYPHSCSGVHGECLVAPLRSAVEAGSVVAGGRDGDVCGVLEPGRAVDSQGRRAAGLEGVGACFLASWRGGGIGALGNDNYFREVDGSGTGGGSFLAFRCFCWCLS